LLTAAAVGNAVAGSLLFDRDAPSLLPDASPSATPTAAATPTAEPSTSPSPSSSPDSTPVPSRGPLQSLGDGWVTVSVGQLNVRAEPSLDATSQVSLVEGAVARLLEGPTPADGYDWYRIVSLGGARGWAASGTQDDPFMVPLVEDETLLHCDQVTGDVLIAGSGDSPVAADPIRIGELAIPASAFDEIELGTLELLRAIRGEACFSAQMGANETPTVYAQLMAIACGRPDEAGGVLRLRPALGQDVVVEYQVKDSAIVDPAVLSGWPGDSAMASDMRSVFSLAARGEDAHRCIHTRVTEGPGESSWFRQVDGKQCVIVDSWTAGSTTVRPSTGGAAVTLLGTGGNPGIATGTPVALTFFAYAFSDGDHAMSIGDDYPLPDCA
ncbi:MAG: SH3 domain-containing protein, partial [Candidatus Limnocylindria bacterium]